MFNWNYGINMRKYNGNLKKQNIGIKIVSEKVKTK